MLLLLLLGLVYYFYCCYMLYTLRGDTGESGSNTTGSLYGIAAVEEILLQSTEQAATV